MKTDSADTGVIDRRAHGKNLKPFMYLLIEMIMLALTVFLISLLMIPIVTVVSVFGAVFFFIMFCIPRYRKIRARQTEKHSNNNIHDSNELH